GRHILMYEDDGEINKRLDVDPEKIGKLLCPRKAFRAYPQSAPPRFGRHLAVPAVHTGRHWLVLRAVSPSAELSPQPTRLPSITGMLHILSSRFGCGFSPYG